MAREQGKLRVYGQGDVEVEWVSGYLIDLKHAYDSILVFESVIDGLERASSEFPFPGYPFYVYSGWPLGPRRAVRHIRDWPPTKEEISSLVPHSEQIILSAVQLQSPGSWEFLGTLNPFEVIRKYLNDRHERKKDREYRNKAERERLILGNQLLKNEVIAGRLKILKEYGVTDRDIAPLLNELINKPLTALGRHQDKGVIEHAEIFQDREKRDP